MTEEKPKKKPNRNRPPLTVTLNPRNLEAAAKYEVDTGKKIGSLLDDLMEDHFLKTGYLSNQKPKTP